MNLPQRQDGFMPPRTGFKFVLSVRGGPDSGAVYQLLPPVVTIGRDPSSNNVVINDAKVSRNAAVIEFQPEDISVIDVSGKKKLSVNGQTGERFSIKGGDILMIGETQMCFIVEAIALPAPNATFPPLSLASGPSAVMGPTDRGGAPSRKSTSPKNNRVPFYAVVGLLFAGIIYIGTSEQATKKLDKGLRTTSEIEKEISATDERISAVEKKRTFRTEEEKTRYEEAQKHYLEGFRDYQKGNYSRAMRSFETARAIDPEHVLAKRYFRQAEKQRDEAITQLLLEGRRYREKDMHSRCSAALEKALILMTNKDDLKYKQAETMKKECDLLQDRRF